MDVMGRLKEALKESRWGRMERVDRHRQAHVQPEDLAWAIDTIEALQNRIDRMKESV